MLLCGKVAEDIVESRQPPPRPSPGGTCARAIRREEDGERFLARAIRREEDGERFLARAIRPAGDPGGF
jgi:hypothetical protein